MAGGRRDDLMRTLSLQLSRRVIQPSRVRFSSIFVGVAGRGKKLQNKINDKAATGPCCELKRQATTVIF